MLTRSSSLTICALIFLPGVTFAGPISFGLSTGDVTMSSGSPALGLGLVPIRSAGAVYTFDTTDNTPVTLGVVAYEPWQLAAPDPRDVHPDGTTHWYTDNYFRVDVTLLDYASGQSATVQLQGRAHLYNQYLVGSGWTGNAAFWFQDVSGVVLGGKVYHIWGTNPYTDGPATVNVWAGDGRPPIPQWTPEPGTFGLALLGLVPLGLRRLRRAS